MEAFMRRVATIVFLALSGMAIWAAAVLSGAAWAHRPDSEPSVAVYDSNPSHPWNRLYAALLVRQDRHGQAYGEDSLDPPLWMETEHLLAKPSHQRAIQELDEFLGTHAETLVHDRLKRVMLQRDLWTIFDWTVRQYSANKHPRYDKEKQDLQVRLAEALRRLALSPDEIKSLPDNYAQAVASGTFAKEYDSAQRERVFLPPDLFDPHGPWVCINPSPESDTGVTPMHLINFSGRSGFLVFVRLPEGRKATYEYFQKLWNFPQPYVQGPTFAADQALVNPDLPSFPPGTEVALVRRMAVFDNQGNLAASSITESVQIRVYDAITGTEERNFGNGNIADILKNTGQVFYEVKLSRPLLFSGRNGGLRAVGRAEKELPTFQQQGDDLIEEFQGQSGRRSNPMVELQTCAWCHSGGGVRSLNSRASLLRPNRMQQEPRDPNYGPIYWDDGTTIAWKQNRFDWGLLNGYWKATKPE
jgi:hypothetical protein